MSLTYSQGLELGTAAPAFLLPGVDGSSHGLDDYRRAQVLLVVFTCNHCPYAQAVEGRLMELQRHFGEDDLQLVAISSNDAEAYPADGFAQMAARAAQQGYNFPYLYDQTQAVARAYRAACTPDPFLFGADRRLVYNGRIDDNWQDETAVTRPDLRLAIEATLATRPLGFEPVPSMGCNIKWRV